MSTSSVPQALRQSIQSSYSALLEQQGFSARGGQKLMIAVIARSLTSIEGAGVSLIEAGTGVGKSFGYLVPSVNIALETNKKLIISTATAALQDQLVSSDLPSLKKALDTPFSYGLVKGRRRYLCQANLDKCLHGASSGMQELDYFEGGQALSREALKLFDTLNNARVSDQWDGDRDHWPEEIDDRDWHLITSDRHGCMGGRCQFFNDCSFYEAREAIEDLDALVVNHDLLLADLMLGGGVILPAPEDSIYVLDEAHHLADKTRNHLSARMGTSATSGALAEIIKGLEKALEQLDVINVSKTLSGILLELKELAERLLSGLGELDLAAEDIIDQTASFGSDQSFRFEYGLVPEALKLAFENNWPVSRKLKLSLEQLSHEIEKLADSDNAAEKDFAQLWFGPVGEWLARLESWLALIARYSEADKDNNYFARWMRKNTRAKGVDFFAAPIEVGPQLGEILWHRAAGAVLTSATLSIRGDFSSIHRSLGLPDNAEGESIASPFDYARIAKLELCKNAPNPRNDTEYEAYIVELLGEVIEPDKATLVLFSSVKQLEQVQESLESEWKHEVLVQGVIPRMEIVRRHKAKIDKGQGSIIFGLRSFAEGIDLPGDYCTHLIITRIPFAVPDDPIEATISERITADGGNSFRQLSLPNAAIGLIQSVGRLIRSENDHGTVTIVDPRLVNSGYGKYLLSSLPPFEVVLRG